MEKEYRELFDGVHASERLRTEVMNMKRAENTGIRSKRRTPAALIAAVLVIVLAGTALAAEMLHRVSVDLVEPDEENISTEGYHMSVSFAPIPMESLSEEALACFAGSEEDFVTRYFSTWTEAVDFLGLDLPANQILSGLQQEGPSTAGGLALMTENGRIPAAISVSSGYKSRTYDITEIAYLEVDMPEVESYAGRSLGQWETFINVGSDEEYYTRDEQYSAEEYVTPSGLTAAIVSRSGTQVSLDVPYSIDLNCSTAYFIKNNAYYTVHCHMHDPAEELSMLKKILDAYE